VNSELITFEIAKEIAGVAYFWSRTLPLRTIEILAFAREFVQTSASFLEIEKRLHSASIRDDVFWRSEPRLFFGPDDSGVMRARRSQRPLGFLLIKVDQYELAVSHGARGGERYA